MAKYPYFDALESLAELSLRAVNLTAHDGIKKKKDDPTALLHSAQQSVCELENALFSDFLPPLERSDIAVLAHALLRILRAAEALALAVSPLSSRRTQGEEAEICLKMARSLAADIAMLRRIRNPREMPALKAFRTLSADGARAHAEAMASCSTSRSTSRLLSLQKELRDSLSAAFDTLVAVMLNNI